MDYLTAFMIGFLGSLHCVGMCGPIALALPLDRSSLVKQFSGIALYNVGRILTYASIGLLFGYLGEGLAFFGWQQQISIGLGILIIVFALLPYSVERWFDINPFMSRLLSKLKSNLGLFLNKRNSFSLFSIGLLNGLLPCGLVYFAILGAISQYDLVEGSVFMAVFGVGTVPLMFAVALSPGFIKTSWRNKIKRIMPYFAIVIGILFILRGLNLGIPYVSPQVDKIDNQSVECHDPQ